MGDGSGAGGTRTPYLILAKDALSLMSYSPTNLVGGGGPPNREPHNGQQVFRPFYGGPKAKRRGRVASTPTLTAGQ